MKKVLVALVLLTVLTLLIAACARPGTQASQTVTTTGVQANTGAPQPTLSTPQASTVTTVHMGMTTFTPTAVTISKGSSFILVNDSDVVHIIANGRWQKAAPQPGLEAGAPTITNLQFSTANQSQTIGPFTAAGTFWVYCVVHPGMNLSVTVQ